MKRRRDKAAPHPPTGAVVSGPGPTPVPPKPRLFRSLGVWTVLGHGHIGRGATPELAYASWIDRVEDGWRWAGRLDTFGRTP